MEDMDWRRIPRREMGTGKWNFISSYLHQWLTIHKQLHERETVGSPTCLMCGKREETENHFLRFKSYQNTEYSLTKTITKILDAQGIDPHLKIILLRGIGR